MNLNINVQVHINMLLGHNLIDELYDNLYEYWTDESVEELAKSCKTKKSFIKIVVRMDMHKT